MLTHRHNPWIEVRIFINSTQKYIYFVFINLFIVSFNAFANILEVPEIIQNGTTSFPYVSALNIKKNTLPSHETETAIKKLCQETAKFYKKYNWKDEPCGNVKWQAQLKSPKNFPLIYATFGEGKNTTLYLGGVHPDELTPIHVTFRFARYLQENPQIYEGKDIKIVIAPLVVPDTFLQTRATRTNINGVDVNRNFFTQDWYQKAIDTWSKKDAKIRGRYFPGYVANSEIETLFQIQLIDQFIPSKIVSIHAPLGFWDYDGPGDQKYHPSSETEKLAKHFLRQVTDKPKGYKVVDYEFFPGSLGNFAGNERHIPTITLELETADVSKVDKYWHQFLPAFLTSVEHPFFTNGNKERENATKFSQYYLEIPPRG